MRDKEDPRPLPCSCEEARVDAVDLRILERLRSRAGGLINMIFADT
jgi:hypothetical protein